MLARAKMGGNLVWVMSQTVIPQLAAMTDAGSHAVWIGGGNLAQGASASLPTTLLGIPIYWYERAPALGTKGDVSLVDFGYYTLKDGSGPFVDMSPHVYFLTNETVIRIVYNVDGKPWLDAPIPLEGSSTSTVSPFIVLDVPA